MKKGFCLIELMITICILSQISLIFINLNAKKELIQRNVDKKYYESSILAFINTSKHKCKAKGKKGMLIFDKKENCIDLSIGTEMVNTIYIPKKYKIKVESPYKNYIQISKRGLINQGSSIYLLDKKDNKNIMLTINVGTGYVEIKE